MQALPSQEQPERLFNSIIALEDASERIELFQQHLQDGSLRLSYRESEILFKWYPELFELYLDEVKLSELHMPAEFHELVQKHLHNSLKKDITEFDMSIWLEYVEKYEAFALITELKEYLEDERIALLDWLALLNFVQEHWKRLLQELPGGSLDTLLVQLEQRFSKYKEADAQLVVCVSLLTRMKWASDEAIASIFASLKKCMDSRLSSDLIRHRIDDWAQDDSLSPARRSYSASIQRFLS